MLLSLWRNILPGLDIEPLRRPYEGLPHLRSPSLLRGLGRVEVVSSAKEVLTLNVLQGLIFPVFFEDLLEMESDPFNQSFPGDFCSKDICHGGHFFPFETTRINQFKVFKLKYLLQF